MLRPHVLILIARLRLPAARAHAPDPGPALSCCPGPTPRPRARAKSPDGRAARASDSHLSRRRARAGPRPACAGLIAGAGCPPATCAGAATGAAAATTASASASAACLSASLPARPGGARRRWAGLDQQGVRRERPMYAPDGVSRFARTSGASSERASPSIRRAGARRTGLGGVGAWLRARRARRVRACVRACARGEDAPGKVRRTLGGRGRRECGRLGAVGGCKIGRGGDLDRGALHERPCGAGARRRRRRRRRRLCSRGVIGRVRDGVRAGAPVARKRRRFAR